MQECVTRSPKLKRSYFTLVFTTLCSREFILSLGFSDAGFFSSEGDGLRKQQPLPSIRQPTQTERTLCVAVPHAQMENLTLRVILAAVLLFSPPFFPKNEKGKKGEHRKSLPAAARGVYSYHRNIKTPVQGRRVSKTQTFTSEKRAASAPAVSLTQLL